jgi:hypothetical protein
MLKETCFPDLKKVHAANPNAIYMIDVNIKNEN